MNAMRQDAQKQSRKFCRSKEDKNSETHPEKPEKGETGCVPGAGEGCSGWRRMKPGEKTRKARRKSRDGLVSAAASAGPGRSPPGCRPPRHALRRAQPCLVAKTFGTLTKNGEVSARLTSPFLCFLSKNDASDQKRGKKNQDLCGFQAFLLFEIVHFPKKMWKTGGAILMRKSENYHAMLGW